MGSTDWVEGLVDVFAVCFQKNAKQVILFKRVSENPTLALAPFSACVCVHCGADAGGE